MKITQKGFNPVTITLETAKEFRDFMGIVDKVDRHHHNGNGSYTLKKDEYEIIRKISDRFSDL